MKKFGYEWRRLFPRYPWLEVESVNVSADDLELFLVTVRATWKRLPPAVRRVILRHWREWYKTLQAAHEEASDRFRSSPLWSPVVRFAPVRLHGRGYWRGGARAAGTTGMMGLEVCFKASYVDLPWFAVEIVAHELGHVYQHAAGYHPLSSREASLRRLSWVKVSPTPVADAEADVARLLKEWGLWLGPHFDPSWTNAENLKRASDEIEEWRSRSGRR